ncbi:peptidoglycan-binding protein [Calothrix sp. UHCC 0171]|uniref:peptidoglycan-binding protein n=1 Tax=Calothrix sp. UHCC 0171 TaxID=3110245 RepID=UPI002B1FD7BD|nr:peptidoglycan-binding protein [Calothrix sp. UHCC 0171]MEA5571477.1 peptidoglycan-binding protein [Calothrix sp. UHCC 0171]
MADANERATAEPELKLRKINFKLHKVIKSACLAFASVGMLLATLPQAQAAVSAIGYVRTNGSCLRVRSAPSLNAPVLGCLRNGSRLAIVVDTPNGFSRLSSGNYVATRYVGIRPGQGNTPGLGVGGPVTLAVGSQGASVIQVQRVLGVPTTGFYGSITARAVRNFQLNNGLLADGKVGPQTRVALGL